MAPEGASIGAQLILSQVGLSTMFVNGCSYPSELIARPVMRVSTCPSSSKHLILLLAASQSVTDSTLCCEVIQAGWLSLLLDFPSGINAEMRCGRGQVAQFTQYNRYPVLD